MRNHGTAVSPSAVSRTSGVAIPAGFDPLRRDEGGTVRGLSVKRTRHSFPTMYASKLSVSRRFQVEASLQDMARLDS